MLEQHIVVDANDSAYQSTDFCVLSPKAQACKCSDECMLIFENFGAVFIESYLPRFKNVLEKLDDNL
ncbi:unnamed protein product [Mesocestoides corti]|uniref:Uncharacterized protein n=1 Tax=Mesocestoides corti TaxID=53468 RepID=A0A0R3UQX7_MESCO|nr:unnamed protein product [Mesocestoides corti]